MVTSCPRFDLTPYVAENAPTYSALPAPTSNARQALSLAAAPPFSSLKIFSHPITPLTHTHITNSYRDTLSFGCCVRLESKAQRVWKRLSWVWLLSLPAKFSMCFCLAGSMRRQIFGMDVALPAGYGSLPSWPLTSQMEVGML